MTIIIISINAGLEFYLFLLMCVFSVFSFQNITYKIKKFIQLSVIKCIYVLVWVAHVQSLIFIWIKSITKRLGASVARTWSFAYELKFVLILNNWISKLNDSKRWPFFFKCSIWSTFSFKNIFLFLFRAILAHGVYILSRSNFSNGL